MKIALVQFSPVWQDKQKNLDLLTQKLENIDQTADLVILPEMFTTGFTMSPQEVYDTQDGITLSWMQKMAEKHQFAITGSVVIKEDNRYFNRLYFVLPNGDYYTYDKRHLFTLAGEDKVYDAGINKLTVIYKDWKIRPLICYDLRFPVYSRVVEEDYELLIYVASWPDQRIYAWDTLLKARAIENMCFVAAVNRSGTDPAENKYSGHSQMLDYMGQYLQQPVIGDKIEIIELSKEGLKKAREKLAFLNDADHFELY
ncbi:nitrilase family protein [Paenimyroides ceti]